MHIASAEHESREVSRVENRMACLLRQRSIDNCRPPWLEGYISGPNIEDELVPKNNCFTVGRYVRECILAPLTLNSLVRL